MKHIVIEKGTRFGKLTVLDWCKTYPKRKSGYSCQCDCGNQTVVPSSDLLIGKTKSCGCLLHEKPWKGCGDLSGNYWNRLKKSALLRGWSFEIDIDYAWELFKKQNKKCKLTDRDLHMEVSYMNPRNKNTPRQTASLDRVNPHEGYIVGNVQWVHVDVNYMKQEMDQSTFIATCMEIVECHQKHKN